MNTRGYVAIEMSFDARTDKVTCTANKDMEIQGTNGATVSLKAGEKFTAVRAGSLGANMWYIVRSVTGEKKCSCPATTVCVHEIYAATGKPLAELRAEVVARAQARKAKKAAKVAEKLDIPAEEVEKIAAIAVEHKQAMKPKHTDFTLPIGPGDNMMKAATKVETKTIKVDYRSAQTLAFFSSLPSRKAIA